MSAADIARAAAALLARTRTARGLPRHIDDPTAIERLASILRQHQNHANTRPHECDATETAQ